MDGMALHRVQGRRMIGRWLCRHGFHQWELWTGTRYMDICARCGKVEHV